MAVPAFRSRVVGVFGLVSVLLWVGGCGDSGAKRPEGSSGAGSVPAALTPAALTPADTTPTASADLLAFTAPLVGGSQLNAATLAGKPVAFWFWAPG